MTTSSITSESSGHESTGLESSRSALSAASTVRVEVEIATLGTEAYAPRELIPLFHELIREQALDDLLIDVADYSHVPEGPGLVLVGHDAVISYRDRLGGPAGRRSLLYSRRRESWRPVEPATPASRLRAALCNTLAAGRVLEQRLGERMRWDTRSFEVTLNDRLSAPHGDATRLTWRSEIEGLAAATYPDARARIVVRGEDSRERLGFLVEGSVWVEPVEAILGRIAPGEES